MWRALWLGLAICLAGPVAAQGVGTPGGLSFAQNADPQPILVIDMEALFEGSLYGRRVMAELRDAQEALASANGKIAASLEVEARSLTERRPEMDPTAFREEAEAFDAKVQDIRAAQDAKERALDQVVSDGQQLFIEQIQPILERLMIERGAQVLLDRRTVVLATQGVEITADAIARIDAAIGDGSALSAAEGPPTAAEAPSGATMAGDALTAMTEPESSDETAPSDDSTAK